MEDHLNYKPVPEEVSQINSQPKIIEVNNNEETQKTDFKQMTNLKIVFKTNNSVSLRRLKIFLQYLEDSLGFCIFGNASYSNNILCLQVTKIIGTWIISFLDNFTFHNLPIKTIQLSDKNEEFSNFSKIIGKQIRMNDSLLKKRMILMTIKSKPNTDFQKLLNLLRKYTATNKEVHALLNDENIIYFQNTMRIIGNTSMKEVKILKELVNTANLDGLRMTIFDYYVKLMVNGIPFNTSISDLKALIKKGIEKMHLSIKEWFIAKYENNSIYIFVPKQILKIILKVFIFDTFEFVTFEFVEQTL